MGGQRWPVSGIRSCAGCIYSAVTLDAENLTVTVEAQMTLARSARRTRRRAGFHCHARENGWHDCRVLPSSGESDRAAVRDALLAVETTLHDGLPARFGSNAVKDVAGYDMKRLFIGSGGAFGTLERVTLRVLPNRS